MDSEGSTSMIELLCYAAMIAGMWKIMEKADVEGWKSLIPFYNLYKMFELALGSGMWVFLLFVPIANIYAYYKLASGLAAAFGKEGAYKWGLFLLPFAFYPMLGFGSDNYYGPYGAGDYRDEDARGSRTVNFEVIKNEPEDDTIHFDVK